MLIMSGVDTLLASLSLIGQPAQPKHIFSKCQYIKLKARLITAVLR